MAYEFNLGTGELLVEKEEERRARKLETIGVIAALFVVILLAVLAFKWDASPHQVKNSEEIAKLESYDPYDHYELNELAAEYVEDEFGIEPVQAYVWIDILRYDTESTCSTIYYKTDKGLWYSWSRNWYALLPAEFEEMVHYVAFTPDAGNSYEDRCYVEDSAKIAELDASDPEYYREIKGLLAKYVKNKLGDKPSKVAFRVNIDNYDERQFELVIWYQLAGEKWCVYEQNGADLPKDLESMLIREFIDPDWE